MKGAHGPLGIRLADAGLAVVVLIAVEISVATGGGPGALTDREREVVALVAAGLSNDEIAARLVVSPLTAKTHVSRSMTKLAARDRAQLAVIAYEHGLAGPGGPGGPAGRAG